jgi:serine/threonine protein kinase
MSNNANDKFLNLKMGDYFLEDIVAVGGMARVYLGRDEKLNRQAAVKVLDLNQEWVDETIIQRFEREARSVAQMEHPNIITIWAYGREHNAYFQVMQFVPGGDLLKALKTLRMNGEIMPVERSLHILRQVASALDYSHARGMIHRDIKPSNVLLKPDDTAVLTDFGLVMVNDDKTMGTAFGTPRYIAPEQAVASQQAVPASDLYALACITYEMLTNRTPFDGETPMEIALAHVSDTPDKPSKYNANIPVGADEAILQALAKEPEERHESVSAFVEEIAAAYGLGVGKDNALVVAAPLETATQPAVEPPTTQPDPAAISSPRPSPIATQEAEIHVEDPQAAASIPLAAQPVPSAATVNTGGNGRGGLLVVVLLLALLGGGAFYVFGLDDPLGLMEAVGGTGPDSPPTLNVPRENAEVQLTYNGELFVIHNRSEYPLTQLGRLTFVRGERGAGADDFDGDRVPGDTIAADTCYRIQLLNSTPELPDACENAEGFEALSNTALFHWRSDDGTFATFDVFWDDDLLVRCNTVQRGADDTCVFRFPLADPNAE